MKTLKFLRGLFAVAMALGVVAVVVLRSQGVRFFGPVPTLVLFMVPMLGSGSCSALVSMPRGRAIGSSLFMALLMGATLFAAAMPPEWFDQLGH